MRLIGPLSAALSALLVLAFFGAFYDPSGHSARRAELTGRLKKVVPEIEDLERYAAAFPPSSKLKTILPAEVPVVEEHPAQYEEPQAIESPEGIAIEATTSVAPSRIETAYKITNSRVTPVVLRMDFDYCTDDDFILERQTENTKLQAGEVRSGVEVLRSPRAEMAKVDIHAEVRP